MAEKKKKKKKKKRDKDHDFLAALKHPLRRCILRVMAEHDQISPSEVAEILEQPVSNVSYHVRELADRGAADKAGEKQVGGATQHFYRWSLDAPWAQAMLEEAEAEDRAWEKKRKAEKRKKKRKKHRS